jgi:hypothetical protein
MDKGDPRQMLRELLARLKGADPFTVLGVGLDAGDHAIHTAYLGLTKKLHPNKFARDAADVRELAHEVFLLVRRAHDELAKQAKRQSWRERLSPPPTTLKPRPAPVVTPPTVPPGAPQPIMPQGSARMVTPPVQRAVSGSTSPPPTGARVHTSLPGQGATLRPAGTPGTPVPPGGRSSTPATGVPTGIGSTSVRPAVAEQQRASREREQRFESTVRLLHTGEVSRARLVLAQIAAEEPQNKAYRAHLQLAMGLEHLAAERLEEAHRELERALTLDNDLDEARRALHRVREAQKKGTGLLGKLFRK